MLSLLKAPARAGTLVVMEKDYQSPDEVFDVYDEDGNRVGRATRREVHADPSLIHRAVHVLVFRSDGRLLMQKRSMQKDVAPGKWDSSVGGHVDAGEGRLEAALRETKEELGLEGLALQYMYDYKYRSGRESEDLRTYGLIHDGPVTPNPLEIESVADWDPGEIENKLGSGVFTRNFEQEWRHYKEWLAKGGRLGLSGDEE